MKGDDSSQDFFGESVCGADKDVTESCPAVSRVWLQQVSALEGSIAVETGVGHCRLSEDGVELAGGT